MVAWLVMCPRMWGYPLSKLEMARMPTAWWLRPVSREARVGEHSGVTWKFEYRRPLVARASIFGVVRSEP